MVSIITCRKCGWERSTDMPQVEDKVHCPHCGLHGYITMSNCITSFREFRRKLLKVFIPLP
jgi:predicted Zn-ribbon and HTH transcriptional regulator